MPEEVDSVYLAGRIKDRPIPFVDCERKTCSQCGEDVWVSKNMEAYWTKYPIICYPICLNALLKEDRGPHTIKVPREVLEGLKKFADSQRSMMER